MSKQVPIVSIYGVPFSKLGMDDTVQYLADRIDNGQQTHVITANPIMVMTAKENPEYLQMMKRADIIVPDGAGVVWAAAKCGQPVAERVTGIDLMARLFEQGEKRKWKVFLLGTSQEVIDTAAEKLQLQYPQVKIVGTRNGFFGANEDAEVIDQIRKLEPHLLFVARGADTQEPWIVKYRYELGVPLIMGVGGSFDVLSGKLKRAPQFMQTLKLEWLFRLLQEPKRFGRMLVLPKFMMHVLRDKEKVTK